MSSRAPTLAAFLPSQPQARRADYLRGAVGAGVGILVTALLGKAGGFGPAELPWIVAPLGASAVLIFAVPASPLAQPWPVVAGNTTAAVVGIAAAEPIGDKALAVAVAVGVAIALMMLLRCLHPPGGAVALLAAYGSVAIGEQGFAFALWPIGANSVCLVVAGLLWNNLTGRRYPHVAAAPPEPVVARAEPSPSQRTGVRLADVEAALGRMDQGFDITPADVMVLVREAQTQALDRRLGGLRAESVMTRQVVTVLEFESVYRVRLLMSEHKVKAVPVVDADRRVVGIVSIVDLFSRDLADVAPVSSVMTSPVTTAPADAPVADLIALMVDVGYRHVPVVDDGERLVGIVTRAELIALMHRLLVAGDGGASAV